MGEIGGASWGMEEGGGAHLVAQLIAVETNRQREGPGAVEDTAGLLGREGDALAEGVDGVNEAGAV